MAQHTSSTVPSEVLEGLSLGEAPFDGFTDSERERYTSELAGANIPALSALMAATA